MADAVGTIRVDLFANLAEWSSGLTKAEGQLNRFAKATDGIAKGFTKAGKTMSAAITAPLVLFAGLATKAASDANDLQGAFNVTFGDAADAVTDWAKSTGDAMQRSTTQVETTAIAFKDFFEDFAPTSDAATELSKRFTGLTEDFAAFKNISDEQAQTVLIKGLAGSAKGLKQFGIDISDAKVRAKALELGITDGTGALTDQQKVLARASIIMQGFSKAQGENARSAGETDQETRRLHAEFDELLVTVGNDLIPTFNALLKVGHDLIAGFNALDPGTRQLIVLFAGVAAAVGPVALGMGGLFKVMGFGAAVTGKLIGAVAGLPKLFAALVAPSVQSAAGIKATGEASAATAPLVGKLGLSIAGAVGWFVALAPVAYAAGAALVNAFKPSEAQIGAVLEAVRQKFLSMGLSADEARAATQQWAYAVDKGTNLSAEQAIALGKQQLATDAATKANSEFIKSIDAVIEEAAAQGAADDAAAKSKSDLDAFIKSLGELKNDATLSAGELQNLRDAIDPVGAALREYNRNLAAARSLGLNATQTQKVLGQAFDAATQDVLLTDAAIAKFPPTLQAAIKAMDDLKAKAEDFGPTLRDEFDAIVPDGFGDPEAFKSLVDSLADTAQPQMDFMQRTQDIADGLTQQFDPMTVYARRIKDIDDAFATGAVSADVFARAKADAFANTPEGQAQVKLYGDIEDELTAAATGAESLGDAFKNLILEALKANIIKPAINGLLAPLFPKIAPAMAPAGGGGGFDFGGVLSGIGSFLGFGSHDSTGKAKAGRTYTIGSGVRETFTPNVDGRVQRDGNTGATVIQNFNGNDVGQYRASRRQIKQQAKRSFAGA